MGSSLYVHISVYGVDPLKPLDDLWVQIHMLKLQLDTLFENSWSQSICPGYENERELQFTSYFRFGSEGS